jgi:DNA transformation protein and related proteins
MDAEGLQELFRDFGPVSVRRMFGGQGIFVDGMMIALVAGEVIYLKADAETIPAFEQQGLAPFSYATRNGDHTLTSYWRMPDRLYDDPEELARWARDAQAVALRRASALRRPSAPRSASGQRKAPGQRKKATKVRRRNS